MLKLSGAILVMFACTVLGLTMVNKKRKTKNALRELASSFDEIAHSIDFSLTPLPEVICRLATEQFTDPQSFLNQLAKEISSGQNNPLFQMWQATTHRFAEENTLPDSAVSIVLSLGETLGKMDCETEITRLQTAAKLLNEHAKDIEVNSEKTEKAVKSLGIILGIFIVVILV